MIQKLVTFLISALILSGCITLDNLSSQLNGETQNPQGMKVANALLKNGDAGTAAGIYEKLLIDQPKNMALLYGYATAIYEHEKYREALIAYENLLAQSDANCNALVGLGNSYLKLGRPIIAGSFFAQCLSVNENNDAALVGRAISFDATGRSEHALSFYRKAISKRPIDLILRNNFALSLLMAGKPEEAVSEFGKIAFTENSTVQIRQNLALAYAMAGDMAGAEEVAALDLSARRVASNLRIYEYVRNLPGNEALKSLIFTGKSH